MSLRKYKSSKSGKTTWKYHKGGLVQYGLGGWLKDNMQGVMGGLKVAGGAALALTGVGTTAGLGMMGSGIGDISQEVAGDRQASAQSMAQMQQRQGMIQMQQQSDATENPYAATFAKGGVIRRTPGYDPMVGTIPEVGVYAKRPMKGTIPQLDVYGKRPQPSIYTPPGGGNWSYSGGADQWFNPIDKDKQGKPSYMSPEDYEKKGGPGYKQLIQAGYRELYGQGGMIPQGMPNAELEKQEVSQGPDGSMQKMNMPSHKNATSKNQVALEPGTRIFSDKLKPQGEKKTYAQLADEVRKQMEKYEQMLYA